MKIYDPRRGEDFVFENRRLNRTFSSLRHNLYVVDSPDETLLAEQRALVKKCIAKTSSFTFFTLSPWSPSAKKLKERIVHEFNSASEHEGSLIGYLDSPKTGALDTLFDIRAEFGGGKTGEWGYGGCVDRFSEPKRLSFSKGEKWNFDHILAEAEKLGCLLYLGDGYTTFMTKVFDDLDAICNSTLGKRV